MIPPLSMWLHIESPEKHTVRLWLPLFLIWLLLLPFAVLALVVAMVVDLFLALTGRRGRYTRFLLGIAGVVSATRGTVVSIKGSSNVNVWIY